MPKCNRSQRSPSARTKRCFPWRRLDSKQRPFNRRTSSRAETPFKIYALRTSTPMIRWCSDVAFRYRLNVSTSGNSGISAYVSCSTYVFSGTALLWSAFFARCYLNSSGHARGVLALFGDLFQDFGCVFRRCGLCNVSLRNNTAAAPAFINNRHAADLVLFQQPTALLDAGLGCDCHRRTRHGVAHSRWAGILARGNHTTGNVTISDDTDRLRVVFALDYGNLATVVLHHHLRRLLYAVLRRAAGGIGRHYVFCLFHGILCSFEFRLLLIGIRIPRVSGA